jgi:molybdate transport system ATP-binding protein
MTDGVAVRLRVGVGGFTLDVDLALPGRGVSVVFGPSGAGKTLLLRCVAGLQRVDAGRLVVNGETWLDEAGAVLAPHRRAVGYVFQDAKLFAHLDVRGNLEFGRRRVPAAQRRVAWEQAIELLGIGDLLGRRVDGLSGGERQRVGIARALLTSPRLMLLDEPLASLDAARKREILPYLERLHEELAVPMLYVSHAADEVARLADHLVVMQDGRAPASGPLADLLARLELPIRLGDDAGVVLAGRIAERDARWHLARIALAGGSVWARDFGVAPGRAVRIRILARDVSIAREPPAASSISNTLAVTVAGFGDDEHPAHVLVRLLFGGDALLARITRRSAHELGLSAGARVFAQVKAVALL